MEIAALVISVLSLAASGYSIWYTTRSKRPDIQVSLSREPDPLAYIVRNDGSRRAENVSIRWNFDPTGTHIPLEHWRWSRLKRNQSVTVPIPANSHRGTNDFHMMIEHQLLRGPNPTHDLSGTVTFDDPTVFRSKVQQHVTLPVVTDTSARDEA